MIKYDLTDSEMRVFRLVTEGKKEREISELLHLSEYTVKRHFAMIREKLDCATNMANAVHIAYQRGILKVEMPSEAVI